jgi:hypothetical protein
VETLKFSIKRRAYKTSFCIKIVEGKWIKNDCGKNNNRLGEMEWK